MGAIGVLAALFGFAKTFIAPVAAGTFKAPSIIYVHGAFAFAWVLVFAAQPLLIRCRKHREHRQLGMIGFIAAAGFTLTAFPVGAFATARDVAAGGGETAISSIVGTYTAALIFFGLVAAGAATRKTPETHKRFMLLASIALLWPAWFRFRHYFPGVSRPDIFFAIILADSFIIIAAARDYLNMKRVHPVWLYFGTALILEQSLEVMMFDSPPWRAVAHVLYEIFGP